MTCPSSSSSCTEKETDVVRCCLGGRPARFVVFKNETIVHLPSSGIRILVLQTRKIVKETPAERELGASAPAINRPYALTMTWHHARSFHGLPSIGMSPA